MLTKKQIWLLAGTVIVGGVVFYIQTSKHPIIKPTKIVYPPKSGGLALNRIYQIVRQPEDLNHLLLTKTPLLLNFVRLGETASNKQTSALQHIVGKQMPKEAKAVSMVSIECDNAENVPLTIKYGARDIPSIVCLNKQLPNGYYCDKKLISQPEKYNADMETLTAWVREHAEDITGPDSKQKSA